MFATNCLKFSEKSMDNILRKYIIFTASRVSHGSEVSTFPRLRALAVHYETLQQTA